MKMLVSSVLDKAVGAFLPPFYSRSQAEAIRSFSDAVAREDSQFAKHADDFVLYKLGEFDDNSGLFISSDPVRVLSVRECLGVDAETLQAAKPVLVNGSSPN